LTRNAQEQIVWRNVVSGLPRDRDTWRVLVALAQRMTSESMDPASESWRFELLTEFAPRQGEVIDGIATVAAKCGASSAELEAMLLERFLELA
jgi:hypothetical protein